MMPYSTARCRRHVLLVLAVPCVALCGAAIAQASPGAVKGKLSKIGDLPVLQVWGTPKERGVALGYHFADEIMALIEGYVSDPANGGSQQYEKMVAFSRQTMAVDARYSAEFNGIVEGIRAKIGKEPVLPSLGRAMDETDLLTFNCLPELSMLGCSSFSVWGKQSGVDGTLAGRNLDWYELEVLLGSQIVVVHAPAEDGSRLGWVSVTWPPFTGCLTGMNAEGVTVSMHDVSIGPPQGPPPFVPRGFALRDAIESAHASTAFEDVARILRERHCAVGNNIPVNRPSRTGGTPSAVFEYDGNLASGKGVTVRRANEASHLFCTNHYVDRAVPRSCRRYETIQTRLAALAKSGDAVGLKEAWKILRSVAYSGGGGKGSVVTLHSVLFEPDRRRLHVTTAAKGRPAHESKPVQLDVEALLRDATGK